jgi:hypothetical protein
MFFPPLSSASRARIASSIRNELALRHNNTICRLVVNVSESLWDMVESSEIGSTGSVVMQLTSVPDHSALHSLMWKICSHTVELSWEEHAFLVHIALEAQHKGIWLCADSPLTVVFQCKPSVHCVSMIYPEALVDYVLMCLES